MDPITYTKHDYGVKLDARTIKLDLAVQRSLVPSRLRKLVGNFQPIMVGEILVSKRADGHYILDGQHRMAAALQSGAHPYLAAEVFEGLSKADEAKLFMGRNDRAGIARVDHDRNLATSGDQATLDIQMAAQAAGFVFVANEAAESTFRDRSAAVQIMRDAERRRYVSFSGPEHLTRVLHFYARTWGTEERPDSLILKAVSKLMVLRNVVVDENRLSMKLRGLPASQLSTSARQYQLEESAVRGMSPVTAGMAVIANQYNGGFAQESPKRIKVA